MFISSIKDRIDPYSSTQLRLIFIFLTVHYGLFLFNMFLKDQLVIPFLSISSLILVMIEDVKFSGFYEYFKDISIHEAFKRAGVTDKDIFMDKILQQYFTAAFKGE